MKIIALDSYTAHYDGLSYSEFEKLGEFIAYDRTVPEEILSRLEGATAVITNKVVLSGEHFKALPDLKYIGIIATGTNVVDLEAAATHNIVVTHVPAYSTDSVAQLVFSYILDYYSKLASYEAAVRNGEWLKSPDFCFFTKPMRELSGKKLGIVGSGDIGKKVAQIGESFGMEILLAALPGREYRESRVFLDDLAKEVDILSFHCPLSPLTDKIVSSELLALMKPSSILINTARGGLVDESALAKALSSGEIAHAYLDVLSEEPPQKDNPLLGIPQATITPHIAWGTREARERLVAQAAKNLEAFIKSEELNRVVFR